MSRHLSTAVLFSLIALAATVACTDVPVDDERNDARLFPAQGVIRGSVTYVGPRPCSRNGHIVGNAVVLVFDRRNPPPPEPFFFLAMPRPYPARAALMRRELP